MGERVRRRALIEGVVQGVWFRAATRDEARRLGLSGWVRNRVGGSVEAVFEGPPDLVNAAIEWCRTGPPRAVVEHVEVTEEPLEGLSEFHITG